MKISTSAATPSWTPPKNSSLCYNCFMIRVYTTTTCPYCHALMDWLEQQNIPYEEVDASGMPDIDVVPVTEINGQRIIGFDRPAIKKALNNVTDEPTESKQA